MVAAHAAGEVLVITGPEEGAAAGYGSLRTSHADREQVIDALKTAFADGQTRVELRADKSRRRVPARPGRAPRGVRLVPGAV